MNTEFKFGKVTSDELIDAFRVISETLQFVNENLTSEDESAKEAARAGLVAISMNDMMTRPIIAMLVSKEAKKLGLGKEKKEEEEENETTQSFTIPVRPSADKS